MKKVLTFAIFISLFASFSMFAHGKDDIVEREVSQMESYQEFFDINNSKPGKYNIMVTAHDKGGNTTIGGPYNIYIDPESDLPVSGITNPLNNMRIPGNLNIVGTCIDDDAVDFVELVFDGDTENPVRATGKEFWSYYMDTTDLEEGIHTIEVWGTDINGLRGKSQKISWHLDRRQPVTAVTSHGLGELVSGKINFKGTITDGNGIKSLTYSLDNGEHFYDTKISEDKKAGRNVWTFSVPVDTRQFPDGPTVCWFKATDKQGSTGIYSFLYFIDNTPPDIQVVYPEEGNTQNGVFTFAGFAKDTIGIQKLTWECAGEKGEFELIPGNPYWYKEVNTIGLKGKDVTFSVSGTDIAGNTRSAKRTISLNQESDKPVVTIETPATDGLYDGAAGTMFVRGIATDDDGVAAVLVKLDGADVKVNATKIEDGTEVEVETADIPCEGVFCIPISTESDLSLGKHTVTISAKDIHGVVGNPVSVSFIAKGPAPAFAPAEIKGGNADGKVTPGISVHPESGASFVTTASAPCGIAKISWRMEWGGGSVKEGEVLAGTGKNAGSAVTLSIPAADMPWGIVRIIATAEDNYGRSVTQNSALNVLNLNRIYTDEPGVVFDNAKVDENGVGTIYVKEGFPASGYFVGGKARSVEIVPKTPFATASLNGNTINLSFGTVKGTSQTVKVRVITDQNLTYESIPLVFQSEVENPTVSIFHAADSRNIPIDGSLPVHIGGSVKSSVPVSKIGYRIFSVRATTNGDLVTGISSPAVSELRDLKLRNNEFQIDIPAEEFMGYGVFVVEVVANNGKEGAEAMFVSKLPPRPPVGADGKPANIMAPAVAWFDGVDVYSFIVTQGYNESPGTVYRRSEMLAGNQTCKLPVRTDGAKPDSFATRKEGKVDVGFITANGMTYGSGMDIVLQKGASTTITAMVDSEFPISNATYKIEGSKQPGGNSDQTGKATVTQVDATHYSVDVPLANLPSGVTKIALTLDTPEKASVAVANATVFVIREVKIETDDVRKIYWTPNANAKYDVTRDRYIFRKTDQLNAYANVVGPVTATLATPNSGLDVSSEGNVVTLVGTEDGVYRNVQLRVKDSQGAEYTSPAITIVIDGEDPNVEIVTPKNHAWLKDTIDLNVLATDGNGIESVQYSLDNGENWNTTRKSGDNYTATIGLSAYEEGLITLAVLATDVAGNTTLKNIAVQKDITPPEATVIIPCSEDIVNGENYLGFIVTDNGRLAKAEYFEPQKGAVKPKGVDIPLSSMITTLVGTTEQPINDLMSFDFTDSSGNVTTIRQWDFIIDNESDLPKAEVHLPEENAVLTRDFEISGVIYDDDGPSTLWYKFDNEKYQKLPEDGTSFSMQVPLTRFTDNEHTVTVYAEDIHGVVGPEFIRNFRISLEEPKGEVQTPPISETVKDTITMTGVATDKNGIAKVYISLDNGNSYNEAIGEYGHDKTEVHWSYTFDTRVIQDGTHVVFLKIQDWYGIEGLYSSLINIDNTAPEITLELPLDDSKTRGVLFFSGYTMDNIKLTSLDIKIRSLEGKSIPANLANIDLEPEAIITKAIDLTSLSNGFYNVEMTGRDAADNITRVSRNIQLDKTRPAAKVDLLYPLNGEHVQGSFNIYGTAISEVPVDRIVLSLDGEVVSEAPLTESGYFKYTITPEMITEGEHKIKSFAYLTNGTVITSNEQSLIYKSIGPWVTIDAFNYGDFAYERPFIQGNSGYTVSEDELIASRAKDATKEFKNMVAAKSVEKVEISFNNGKTFKTVSKSAKWRYRVENGEMPEGYHFLLVRATMKNGEVAVTRLIVQIDKNAPTVRIISPGEGGHFNQTLDFSGLTRDDIALKSVTLALRKGDKASYEVPAFIQGLYLDWQFWGASLFNIGAGLTFFDDNVKIQFQWGQFTRDQWEAFGGDPLGYRYGGDNILGMKLLANVYYLPFAYMFGPDLEWLAMNIALGANFSYFSDSGAGKGQFLSALLAQLEFPRISLEKQKMFRTIAFYTEGQFWFCPSDVGGTSDNEVPTIVPQISFGIRINVF